MFAALFLAGRIREINFKNTVIPLFHGFLLGLGFYLADFFLGKILTLEETSWGKAYAYELIYGQNFIFMLSSAALFLYRRKEEDRKTLFISFTMLIIAPLFINSLKDFILRNSTYTEMEIIIKPLIRLIYLMMAPKMVIAVRKSLIKEAILYALALLVFAPLINALLPLPFLFNPSLGIIVWIVVPLSFMAAALFYFNLTGLIFKKKTAGES